MADINKVAKTMTNTIVILFMNLFIMIPFVYGKTHRLNIDGEQPNVLLLPM